MIEDKTVFILGAGASVPYGYPTGAVLRDEICNNFLVYMHPHLKFNRGGVDVYNHDMENDINAFRNDFLNSGNLSIDKFLTRNSEYMNSNVASGYVYQNYEFWGRIAIVLDILKHEKSSVFNEKVDKYWENDWYSFLFDIMTDELNDKHGFKKFSENNVSFITFNYDRSLEHYLYTSLRNSFNGATEDEIICELKKISFKHVYGQVALLPWQNPNENHPYRHSPNFEKLKLLANNIKVIDSRNKIDHKEFGDKISEANYIIFLGFGFAKENLDILKIQNYLHKGQRIYISSFGLTETQEMKIIQKLCDKKNVTHSNPIRNDQIHFIKGNCKDTLKDCPFYD